MNRPELYFKTSKILREAYKNETLFLNNWSCCGDGNIIAANMGYTMRISIYSKDHVVASWKSENGTVDSQQYGLYVMSNTVLYRLRLRFKLGKRQYQLQKLQVASTGYTRKELLKIAESFDLKKVPCPSTENILDSLKSALAALKAIHKVDAFDLQKTYRKQFVEELRELNKLPEVYDRVKEFHGNTVRDEKEVLKNYYEYMGLPLPPTPALAEVMLKESRFPAEVQEPAY
jgi:hypothetical protein